MKKIKLKRMVIENFKGCKRRMVYFSDRTKITGRNASGKTTIFDAFTWLLFDKDSSGATKFQVRPLNENGEPLHYVDISVECTLEIDGIEMTITKVQKEKWTKKRGEEDQVFSGNVNEFSVNGYPKSEKDYKEFINGIIDEKMFRLITNPMAFTSMPWKDQRQIIFKLVDNVTDLEIAQSNGQFAPLVPELAIANIDEIRAKYTKSKNELAKKQTELPARIDELAKMIGNVDVAELELARNEIKERIAKLEEEIKKVDDVIAVHSEKSKDVLELKFALSDMERKANEERQQAVLDLKVRKNAKEQLIREKNVAINNTKNEMMLIVSHSKELQEDIKKATDEWQKCKAETFDETTLKCPTCGQKLPEKKRKEMMADFETKKESRLSAIAERGNKLKADLDNAKARYDAVKPLLDKYAQEIELLNKDIADIDKEISKADKPVDLSKDKDYKSKQKAISKAEKEMELEYTANSKKDDYLGQLSALRDELIRVETEIAKADTTEVENRKEELEEELRDVGQRIANSEKMLYILECFIKEKLDRISASVNERFQKVCFKLFEKQINGGVAECCECTVNGVPFSVLNNGHKIVAGLDIINTLSKIYGVSAPVVIDNAESVNEENIPDMACQTILMYVNANDNLEVKNYEN